MTTTQAGGKITGILALTLATDLALNPGDFVQLIGNYKVGLADGTKPCLGYVSVAALKGTSTATSYGVSRPTTGSQVTVEVRGLSVKVHAAGATIAAGVGGGITSAGALGPDGANIAHVGIALTGGTVGVSIDVLVQ
jgi:hypothetical protein